MMCSEHCLSCDKDEVYEVCSLINIFLVFSLKWLLYCSRAYQ